MKSTLLQIVSVAAVATMPAFFAGCRPALIGATAEAEAAEPTAIIGATAQYEGLVMTASPKPFVIMSDDGMQHSFEVASGTKIKVDGHPAKLEQVKSGDKAAVTADTHQGQVIATLIEVESVKTQSP